ncbi:helix-turn-helix domain-containing protein [Streptomyces sp. NPDC048340]|uniref:helix-turn-helix domain-containing protein n=1 Tax=Streptomyces sp. NPDC048340 TaxID=3365537 RepID=UPI0037120613
MGAWNSVPNNYVPRGDEGTEDELQDSVAAMFSKLSGEEVEAVRVPATFHIENVLPRDLRKRELLMQADVAERMGVKQQTVARIEREHHIPENLSRYLAALGYRLELVAVRDGERFRLG